MSRALGVARVRIDALDAERDVLPRGQPRQQVRRLEHHAAIGPGGRHLAAVEHDAAVGDIGQPGAHRQHRRLAAAGVADQRDELAALDVEVEILRPRSAGPCGVGIDLVRRCRTRRTCRDSSSGFGLLRRAHGLRQEIRRGDRAPRRAASPRLRPAHAASPLPRPAGTA